MSHIATNWAFQQPSVFPDMKPPEWSVLIMLADCHNPAHGCFPSQERMAKTINPDERTVRRKLAQLKQRGLIWWDEGKEKGRRINNRYRLAFEEDFPSIPNKIPEGRMST